MFTNRKKTRSSVSFLIMSAILLITSSLLADARTDYLLNLLEKSTNYRLRVQAATTLGKLRSKEAIPALVKATKDKNELVVISAAIALKQIGDGSIVGELEKAVRLTASDAAKSQLKLTIQVLKSIGGVTRQGTRSSMNARYLIRVDEMGNSSQDQRPELVAYFRKLIVNRLKQEGDVVLQQAGLSNAQVEAKKRNEKLVGYIVSGSIIRLDRQGNDLTVKLGLNVFTNPEYNLVMMPTTEATIRVGKSVATKGKRDQQEIEDAIRTVADSLVSEIFRNLRQMETR